MHVHAALIGCKCRLDVRVFYVAIKMMSDSTQSFCSQVPVASHDFWFMCYKYNGVIMKTNMYSETKLEIALHLASHCIFLPFPYP